MHLVPGSGESGNSLPGKDAAVRSGTLLAVPFLLRVSHGKVETLSLAGDLLTLLGALPGDNWLTPWLHPRDAVTALPDYASLAATQEVVQLFRVLQAQGDYRWLQQTCRLKEAESHNSHNSHNSPDDYRIEGLLIDGTRQHEREEAELRYRNFSELAGDWYWEQDENFCFTYFSKEFAKITGVSLPLTLGKPRWASVGSLDATGIDWAGHIRTHEAHLPFRNFEYPSRVGNRPLWIRASGRPKFDEDGRFAGYVGVASEIGDYKRAEEAAIRAGIERDVSRAGLAQVLGGSSVATFVIDRDHRVAYWNRACENLTGVSAVAVVGTNEQWRPFYTAARPVMADLILSGEGESRLRQHYPGKWQSSKLIAGAYEAEDFFPHFGSDGRWVFFTAAPLRDEAGQLVGAIETLQDVTERKQMESFLQESEARYRAVAQSAHDAIITADSRGNIVSWNRGAEAIFGYREFEVIGLPLTQLMPPANRERHRAEYSAWLIGGVHSSADTTTQLSGLHKTGREFPMELSLASWETPGGRFLTGIIRDTSERKLAEEQLRIAAIVFEAQEGMIIADTGGVMLRVNSAFTRITGYAAEEAVGRTMRLLHSGRHLPEFYTAMWDAITQNGSWQGEIWNRRKSGEVYPEWLSITAVKGEAGEVTHYVGTFTDVTHKKAAEDEIRHLAFYDALTDLPNRMLLNDRLQQALVAAKRDDAHIALLFLDLDKFKPVNDSFGHDVGDHLLKEAARRILACVRESDTVARIGGDEFIVLLRTVEDARDALAVAEKIRAALNQPFALKGLRLEVSSSIGLALYPAHGSDAFALAKNADIAMYQAKSAGRNSVRIFSPDSLTDVFEESAGGSKSIVRLVWRAAYNSGNPVIDQEHRELFRLANVLLEKAGVQRDEPIEFDAAFDALLRHLVEHFAHEESILASHGYAQLAEHAAQHQALVAGALKLNHQAAESIVSIGELVEFLVAEVVAGHLLKKDRSFFGLFAEGRKG
jgi:diguanylate cyclase (GGDEF)-like protein/PAS domain S-box-containing protein/hemerythrin-like metal-binding protein